MRGTGLLVLERVGGVGVPSVGIEAFMVKRGLLAFCVSQMWLRRWVSRPEFQGRLADNKEYWQEGECERKERVHLQVATPIQNCLVQALWHSCTGDSKAAGEAARHGSVEGVAQMYRFRVWSTLIAVVCPLLGDAGAGVIGDSECLFLMGSVGPKQVCFAAILPAKLENKSTSGKVDRDR